MAELLDALVYLPSLVLAIVVFGFAPGFCLRLIVLVYPRSDPRRVELIAELYRVPRIERPLWVAEQMEVALFEGVSQRWRARLARSRKRRRRRSSQNARGVVLTLDTNVFHTYRHLDGDGRLFRLDSLVSSSRHYSKLRYEFLGVTQNWKYTREKMQDLYDKGLIVQSSPGRPPCLKRYLDERLERAPR